MTIAKNMIAAALARAVEAFGRGRKAFCNIAEGTHAGSITLVAQEEIPATNLLVKIGESENKFEIAEPGERPLGVCTDCGAAGDVLAVSLAGCAESTFMCRAASEISAGQNVYAAAGGKVSAAIAENAHKIGVAVCAANTGGIVEIDPVGFGNNAYQVFASGLYTWTSGIQVANLTVNGLKAEDTVIAVLQAYGGTEKSVRATANENKISLSLDANGVSGATKVSWIAIRKG